MPTMFIHVYSKHKPEYNTIIFVEGRTWYFVLHVIICLFSDGQMVMSDKYGFDFFHVILYILYCLNTLYVQNY